MKGKNLNKIKLFDQISLSDSCKSVILGSILGDGSLKLYDGYKNARLSIRHSNIQKDYLLWKMEKLSEINNLKSLQIQQPTGYSKQLKLLYQSQSHEELTKLYALTYKKNKLNIKRRWLNHMTPLSLAVWWLDDGSLIGNRKKGVICTDGFSEKSVNLLSNYLFKVWKIKTRVGNVRRIREGKENLYPRIWISTYELRKFFDIIKEWVPECIKYKINMK